MSVRAGMRRSRWVGSRRRGLRRRRGRMRRANRPVRLRLPICSRPCPRIRFADRVPFRRARSGSGRAHRRVRTDLRDPADRRAPVHCKARTDLRVPAHPKVRTDPRVLVQFKVRMDLRASADLKVRTDLRARVDLEVTVAARARRVPVAASRALRVFRGQDRTRLGSLPRRSGCLLPVKRLSPRRPVAGPRSGSGLSPRRPWRCSW